MEREGGERGEREGRERGRERGERGEREGRERGERGETEGRQRGDRGERRSIPALVNWTSPRLMASRLPMLSLCSSAPDSTM